MNFPFKLDLYNSGISSNALSEHTLSKIKLNGKNAV
jgi:hypothetical protein